MQLEFGKILVQTPLDAWLGLGTQRYYESPGDLPFEIVESTVINIGLGGLPLNNGPKFKLDVGQPNSNLEEKYISFYSFYVV